MPPKRLVPAGAAPVDVEPRLKLKAGLAAVVCPSAVLPKIPVPETEEEETKYVVDINYSHR